MLLHYPPGNITNVEDSAAVELIHVIRLLAHDAEVELYAISRPGGLASYMSQKVS
jgi:hypothetical protein